MDSYDAWRGGCMAPVSSLDAVVSWEGEDGSDGGAKAVLASYCVASAEGMVRLMAV